MALVREFHIPFTPFSLFQKRVEEQVVMTKSNQRRYAVQIKAYGGEVYETLKALDGSEETEYVSGPGDEFKAIAVGFLGLFRLRWQNEAAIQPQGASSLRR